MDRESRADVPEFDALKATPSGLSELRFDGGRRPARSVAAGAMVPEPKKPVDLRWSRYRTEIIFGGIFAMVAVTMVIGAITVAIPGFYESKAKPVEQTEANDELVPEPVDEPAEELQGGVKVRKGMKK